MCGTFRADNARDRCRYRHCRRSNCACCGMFTLGAKSKELTLFNYASARSWPAPSRADQQSVMLAISAQSPKVERHPDDQPKHHDCNRNLKPDNSAQLSEHDLEPRAPRFWHLIADGFDRVRQEAQRPADPLWMVDEGGEDQRPRRDHCQKAERVGFGQLADGRTVARLNGEHAGLGSGRRMKS